MDFYISNLKNKNLTPIEESIYKYKFNEQERQEELGLNMYDMPFRDYDPAVARWTGIDPVVDFDRTPYGAHNGNPVFWADPSGANAEFDRWVSGVESDWAAIDAGANPFEVFFNRMMSDQQHNNAIKRAFNVLKAIGKATGGGGPIPDDAIEVSEGVIVPDGEISFVGLTGEQLKEFRIIQEDSDKFIIPTNNTIYTGDGFYQRGVTNSNNQYWYKVSGGSKVTISYSAGTYVYSEYWSEFWQSIGQALGIFANKDYYVGFLPVDQKHWTDNPFIKK
jgi:RHS repeat-associated protein